MKRYASAIIILYLLVYILPLGVRPLIIPDETRYAEIPREIVSSGDWTVPHLAGVRYFEKPILSYWLNAVALKIFGQNAFAIRFSSTVAVGLSGLLVFLLVSGFGGGRAAGLLAAAVFLTFAEVFVVGVFCSPDSVFTMFITAALAVFYFAYNESEPMRRLGYLVLAGIFCGLAFLTKGFIALAVPAVVILPFLLWQRRTLALLQYVWVPLLTAVLVSLPWALRIHFQENSFWHYFIWEEHIKRFFGEQAQHTQPMWFFLPILLVGGLPWTALLPVVISGLGKRHLRDPLIRFGLCWLLGPLLFFSASRGKLGTYILPCYPGLAILVAAGLQHYFASGKQLAFSRVVRAFAIFLPLLALGLLLVQTVFSRWRIYDAQETWKWILLTFGMLLYGLLLIKADRSRDSFRKIILCCLGPAFLMFSAHFLTPNMVRRGKIPERFFARHINCVGPDTFLVSDNYLAPAVCWFYNRSNVYLLGRGGEFSYGLGYHDVKNRQMDLSDFRRFIQSDKRMGKIALIIRAKRYADYKQQLPVPSYEDTADGFVYAEYALRQDKISMHRARNISGNNQTRNGPRVSSGQFHTLPGAKSPVPVVCSGISKGK